jgi:hypothetical protein
MQVSKSSNRSAGLDSPEQFEAYIAQVDSDIKSLMLALQGRISFGALTDGATGENISGETQVVTDTGAANTQFTVTHTLGATPLGYIVMGIDKAGVVYESGTAWTSTSAYFKCSEANAEVKLFLLK